MDDAIKNEKGDTGNSIIWIEGNGIGYRLIEEDYEKRKVKKPTKPKINFIHN